MVNDPPGRVQVGPFPRCGERKIKENRYANADHRAQCCFDIDTASRIITEVWRRVDAGEGRADWKPVCEDLDLQVL